MSGYIRRNILEMPGYTPGEQPQKGEAVKMNTNENPYRASEHVYEAIRRVADEGLSRYPNATGEEFRRAASKILGVPSDWILCGNGSDDILTILTRAFVPEGGLLRLAYPSYILYRSLAQIQGAASEEVLFGADWSLPDYFGAAPSIGSTHHLRQIPNTKLGLVYLPVPNSPSGTIIPKERILAFAESLPCPLLIDEAYVDFAQENCIDLVRTSPKIMVSRTLSKAYSLAGLRFGFLIARPETILELIKVKDSYNCDSLSIAAAAAAIADQPWRVENRQKILATRETLIVRMRKLGFTVPDSHANFTWNVHPDQSVSHKAIYKYLKAHGYLVRYMVYPGWEKIAGRDDGLRITVGTDTQTEECLDLIEKFLS
jgi:histidinol-phosphate aminotransferase